MPQRNKKMVQILEEMIQETNLPPKKEDGVDEVSVYKDYTKVFTPSKIADTIAELAELTGQQSVLEPSAGLGAIIKAVHRRFPTLWIDYYELNENHNTQVFITNSYVISRGVDFLGTTIVPRFDRVLANPPFDSDKWLFHIPKMYKSLAPKGILVTLAPKIPLLEVNRGMLFTDFKNKMKELGAESYPAENWHTNKDGTKTEIHIIKIRKPL